MTPNTPSLFCALFVQDLLYTLNNSLRGRFVELQQAVQDAVLLASRAVPLMPLTTARPAPGQGPCTVQVAALPASATRQQVLTAEQLARAEQNRQAALLRRAQRMGDAQGGAPQTLGAASKAAQAEAASSQAQASQAAGSHQASTSQVASVNPQLAPAFHRLFRGRKRSHSAIDAQPAQPANGVSPSGTRCLHSACAQNCTAKHVWVLAVAC